MKSIEFNTGREYTPEGQRITATVIDVKPYAEVYPNWADLADAYPDGVALVHMEDHSRRVDYVFEMTHLTESAIMNLYDTQSYKRDNTVSDERFTNIWKRKSYGKFATIKDTK